MTANKMKTYQEIIEQLDTKGRQNHLLLGNGFSMAYDSEIFSYNKLAEILEHSAPAIRQLVEIIKTSNFELLMKQLDNVVQIANVFGAEKKVVDDINETTNALKTGLINAVKELHPDHIFTMPDEKSKVCATFLYSFLSTGGKIFTTNYDLLLYWVLMRHIPNESGDGFGKGSEEAAKQILNNASQRSELCWGQNKNTQSIHYVHGALHLFDDGIDIIKEKQTPECTLLENINARMEQKKYPIFVTAGTAAEKLIPIRHNRYLSHCYDALSTISDSLICFGFGFGESDQHIIGAINKATEERTDEKGNKHILNNIYIGFHPEGDSKRIQSIENDFRCDVTLFDATTISPWG